MTGFDLLWPGGLKNSGLNFSDAASDLELDRLSTLLLSGGRTGINGAEALSFLLPLLADDRDTIVMRQSITNDLINNPALLAAFKELDGLLSEISFYSKGMEDNIAGLGVTKMDTALDGLKKMIIKAEKNLSKQGADIIEELSSENRYAQLLRCVIFRYEMLKLYTAAISLLKTALISADLRSEGLIKLKAWVTQQYEKDCVEKTGQKIRDTEEWWKGINAFSVDVCLTSRKDIVGLEIAEIRSQAYEKNGMLEPEPREGISSLIAFPQTGEAIPYQEYIINEVGYEARNELTRLRSEIIRLQFEGRDELLSLSDALFFYISAAEFALRMKKAGIPVCIPAFSELAVINAQAAYMPELALTGAETPVANDIYLGSGGYASLITGPNSSGKTCYIMLAGQLLFLFQLGCFLPCASAELKPADKILTLFATGESDTGEDSRMGMEVIKIAEITKAMTPRSLILLNEPMTSTSAAEGIEICTDLLIELISKRVSSMMVTHFTDIYELLVTRLEAAGLSQRLKSYIMTTSQGSDNTISYLYKLKEAPPQRSSHARAVVGKLGVTLDSMLERLDSLGLDIRPQDTAWKRLRKEMLG
jgi:hypothetical protein